MLLYSTVSTLKPIAAHASKARRPNRVKRVPESRANSRVLLGIVVTTSPHRSWYRIVVLPAPSNPRIKIRTYILCRSRCHRRWSQSARRNAACRRVARTARQTTSLRRRARQRRAFAAAQRDKLFCRCCLFLCVCAPRTTRPLARRRLHNGARKAKRTASCGQILRSTDEIS